MAFDYKQFATSLGMSAEDQTALDGLFGKYPVAGEKIDGYIAQEISARMTPLQEDLAKKQKDLDAQYETLSAVRGNDSKELDEARKRYEEAAAKVTVAQERIKRMAAETGLDPETYLKDLTTVPVTTPVTKVDDHTFDPKAVVQQAGVQAWNALTSAADLQDIAQEHFALFGKPLTNSRDLLNELQERVRRTGNTNLGLRDIWQDKFKVDDRRKELTAADIKRQTDEAYERGKREAADAAALGSQTTQTPAFTATSPIAAVVAKDAKPVTVNGVPEAVSAAISTYRKTLHDMQRAS